MSKKTKPINSDIENEINCFQKEIFESNGIELTNLIKHSESKEYSACRFRLNNFNIEYRVSKITPTKTGQFVTIWKRDEKGLTAPFDTCDDLDFIIITSKYGNRIGQFIFPKSILIEKGIISQNGIGGKRGIRVYPPWDNVENNQALKTQHWQNQFFSESITLELLRRL